jgi:hypothetical protein
LLGATTTSFKSYVLILDSHVRPLLRLIATDKLWNASAYPQPMAAGSEVLDATSGIEFRFETDGTAWTKTHASANDASGTIIITAGTSASVTFATRWARAPVCVLTPTAVIAQPYWVTSSASAITAALSAPGTIKFNYICLENPH